MREDEKHRRVLSIVHTLSSASPAIRTIFTQGACYRLYDLLSVYFPDAEPWLSVGHVITKIDDRYYDIDGETTPSKSAIRMDMIAQAQAEAASVCHLTVTEIRSEPWPTREEMQSELRQHTPYP